MGKAGAERSEVQLEARGCSGERSERRAGLSVGPTDVAWLEELWAWREQGMRGSKHTGCCGACSRGGGERPANPS